MQKVRIQKINFKTEFKQSVSITFQSQQRVLFHHSLTVLFSLSIFKLYLINIDGAITQIRQNYYGTALIFKIII